VLVECCPVSWREALILFLGAPLPKPGHGGIAGPAILTTVIIWSSGVVQDVIMDESSGSEALVGMEETGPVVEI